MEFPTIIGHQDTVRPSRAKGLQRECWIKNAGSCHFPSEHVKMAQTAYGYCTLTELIILIRILTMNSEDSAEVYNGSRKIQFLFTFRCLFAAAYKESKACRKVWIKVSIR